MDVDLKYALAITGIIFAVLIGSGLIAIAN
ncbi:YnhF family membrane protein [Vibrio ruber]|uniref:YnhF family membrane protein n=1 Tax=Vibrio ruber (strain DSM 16370 / JCM 11486 / BCRC 17186 / CECT 7878 / LMG 23124 / VR1) TaxID=1123498 RepID=A0A1R4LFY9_VIBR1|nr:YnhF family membrane protein [Vibrio ruber]WNJ94788.1 YnhF family membrane protein [Vibrio ruber]SJN55445.1 hypothetical protein VR7878_01255 [Vibrio ruber DSM 16370]